MELMELYNQIHNPIDDISVIEKLINAYANNSKGFGGYYGQLTKTVQKEHNKGQYYREDADRFYAMLFNKWKNSIVAMTRDEFVELYKQGSYGQDFIKMRNYLKNIPDVSTMKEADEIFYGSKGDKELEDALEKYSWKSFGGGSGWIHVCSRYLTAKKDQYPNVEHRLYLDTESLDTYKMTTYLVEKCDEHNLPYYFKFDQYADRDDTIVIYSSTENLTKYVEILQEIKREHPELVSRAKEPPVLTGKIDGWIGYGSEPAKTPDGQRHSFNEIRAKVLENSIGKVTKQWIMNHRNQQITYQGQKMLFQEYIAMKSTEKLIADLERRYLSYEENDKKVAQRNGTKYNPTTVNDRLGYTLQDVRSPQFKQNIYRVLRDKMISSLPQVCNGSYKDMDAINMNVRNGKQITFSGYDLETIIQQLSVNISKNDPNFISSVQAEIKNNAKQYGIDSEKFCFDTKARETMRTMTAQREAQKQQQARQVETKIKQPQNDKAVSTKSIDMNSLNVQTLPEIINPALMERKMKLPNGAEISARQYIQEIVCPQLPKNGIVILDNGAVLPVKQFIEEGVMFECQEKYNGDFPRYMAERTRNNLGVVSIENGDEKYEINPVEITEFINPTLLEKKVKLPNGVEISARQYIQEVYAPHIPANGRVTLSNGVDISVKQYIEEELLWKDQEKYNGDISQILYNATRNNTGTINADPQQLQQTLIEMRNQTDSLNNQHSNSQRR
jgi:hypothetical protein